MKQWFSTLRRSMAVLCGSLFVVICVLLAARDSDDSIVPVRARPTAAGQPEAPVAAEFGKASYYGVQYQGRRTASGEIFDINLPTAAHRTLAFGTRVRVTNLANGRSVVVRINDRGPFVEGRIIDLSQAAAERLQMVHDGVAEVKVEVVE